MKQIEIQSVKSERIRVIRGKAFDFASSQQLVASS
jgi:hypothetical protein